MQLTEVLRGAEGVVVFLFNSLMCWEEGGKGRLIVLWLSPKPPQNGMYGLERELPLVRGRRVGVGKDGREHEKNTFFFFFSPLMGCVG